LSWNKKWSFWIDRGGTFTDIIARSPEGILQSKKLLSESNADIDPAVAGINQILKENFSNMEEVSEIRMGTTIGTNALLERKGARTVLVTTQGFGDIVRIGYQNRPDIFALEIVLPEQLYETVIEFQERIHADGEIAQIANEGKLRSDLKAAYESGIQSCAIALLHGYRYPKHEEIAVRIAAEVGFKQISCSHECAALMKYVSRTDTTLVDAYLTPLLRDYVDTLESNLGKNKKLFFMQSNGGLCESALFRGKDSILSGPAGGLIGAVKAAHQCGFEKLITFDMGGTSTDVAHFAGEVEYIYDKEISGVRIRAPMMDIHTVAAGGGSILTFDGSRYRVGPESAGAKPGPKSYRNDGPLTVTDANLLLGRIRIDHFPKIFGENCDEALDRDCVKAAFENLAQEISDKTRNNRSSAEVAFGFLQIAVSKMANAIKHVSVQRGHDARECALVCFGGAGGQVACMIADELGIQKILIHPLAGLLSAYGIGHADRRIGRDIDINEDISTLSAHKLHADIEHTRELLSEALSKKGIATDDQELSVQALLRMEGSDYTLSVPFTEIESMVKTFHDKHLQRYGFSDSKRKVVLQSLSIQLVGRTLPDEQLRYKQQRAGDSQTGSIYSRGLWCDARIVDRNSLQPNTTLVGPAIVVEKHTTTVIDLGWQVELLKEGSLLLTHTAQYYKPDAESSTENAGTSAEDMEKALSSTGSHRAISDSGSRLKVIERGGKKAHAKALHKANSHGEADPVTLELFNNLFRFVAEQMGITLQNTSYSVNIKERLDFSCALFDGDGNLIANAPHMPVHLGSMGESVKNLIENHLTTMRPGDVYATNDPYNGGTHLPDITVISPAFDENSTKVLFYVASRGHHADIGGISPGSMPSDSKTIDEEGVLFKQELIVRDGKFLEDELHTLLNSGTYPARNSHQNVADLKAQVAANTRGINEMKSLISDWGQTMVLDYLQHVQDNADECMRRTIQNLHPGQFTCTMDDGSEITVDISINKAKRTAIVDFTGTSQQSESNLNAPLAVTKAAVLYVFRTLIRDDIPLNAGCFVPLELRVPSSSLLNPEYPAAVVAGNVETSQVIVDTLYGALGIMAGAQGTMNNLSFGNERYQYYETICGGTGAGDGFNGAGPVQSHMTNSRLTDPEVLETLFPVIVEHFRHRPGSGGAGKYRGGDGAIRRIRFKEPMLASILSNRRSTVPHGLAGGKAGAPGRNFLAKPNGKTVELEARAKVQLQAGDCLEIETPGGGGFGA
jgi:5-oxoprolinase (ATP-hydrolysing)